MIDFHSHTLPGIDDGSINIDESIAMASSLSAFGYKTVCCTPHCIKGYYDLTPQKVREATLMLQADLDNADISLELWPGMEYMLDECFAEYADDLLPLGDTKLVLCEAPQQAHPGIIQESLELILAKGFVPLIAHPERTEYFCEILSQRVAGGASREKSEEPIDKDFEDIPSPRPTNHGPLGFVKRLFSPRATRHAPRSFKAVSHPALPEACLFQANLGSFTNYYGPTVQRKAYEFLINGVYTALASDLHDGASASKILVHDKFDSNPLLKKLADWDGEIPVAGDEGKSGKGQGELF